MSYKIDCLKCVKSDWYHKWCSLHNYRLCDYVKGPFKFPMVTVPLPYIIKERDEMDRCDCTRHLKECYSKPGIPDPWSEYLILGREKEKGRDLSSDYPKCDLDITRYLDQNYRVYIGQGIPDPLKNFIRIEPLEPNFDDLKKNLRSYTENLRIGPGCDMYDVDKVCCPNCNRRLLVLCLKKSGKEKKEMEKGVVNTDSVSKPEEEKLVEQKIYLKDACVETDSLPLAKNEEVQTTKKCSCELRNVHNCNNKCSSCPVCNQLKNQAGTERCRCKKNDSCCDCKKNLIKNGYFYNSGPNCPLRNKNMQRGIPVTDQDEGPPLPKLDNGRMGSILPFFCTGSDHCGCSPRQFIGFEEKNNHGLELQLICPKCERKRKKKRKTKCNISDEPRKENHFPCHCRNNESDSFPNYMSECNIRNCSCQAPHFKKQVNPNTSFNADHRCQCCCKEAKKTGILEDRDYLRLLKILGCTNFLLNELNTDYDEPKMTRHKIYSKGKKPSFSRNNHSHWNDNIYDINRERLHDSERGWPNHSNKQYGISRHSLGTKNEFETVEKDSRYTNKKQIPQKLLYNSHNAVDELRKMRSHSRRLKHRSAFKKELNYFLSNCSKNRLSNDSESSSQTRTWGFNTVTKAGRSSWQKHENII